MIIYFSLYVYLYLLKNNSLKVPRHREKLIYKQKIKWKMESVNNELIAILLHLEVYNSLANRNIHNLLKIQMV